MNADSYYLGATFASIAERIEALDEMIEEDKITLEDYERTKDSLRYEIDDGGPLSEMIFESLESIASDEDDILIISTSDLVSEEINADELDAYLQKNECLAFVLLADSTNLAEYVVELHKLGWNMENRYRFNTRFTGVYFEWEA